MAWMENPSMGISCTSAWMNLNLVHWGCQCQTCSKRWLDWNVITHSYRILSNATCSVWTGGSNLFHQSESNGSLFKCRYKVCRVIKRKNMYLHLYQRNDLFQLKIKTKKSFNLFGTICKGCPRIILWHPVFEFDNISKL